jgi:peptide-methionine (R)-S-oxide reductase
MFETNIDRDSESPKIKRRTFLVLGTSAVAGLLVWSRPQTHILEVDAKNSVAPEVTIVRFSDRGERLKTERVPKVVKTEQEWRQQLSPNVFDITRHADTEFAYSGKYWNLHDKGLYRCICCDNALFSSETKFDSGTGWPSFWQPIAAENVLSVDDKSWGMLRTAVSCTLCDAHLGHVFDDGPAPTNLRYCMNSVSLKFVKSA